MKIKKVCWILFTACLIFTAIEAKSIESFSQTMTSNQTSQAITIKKPNLIFLPKTQPIPTDSFKKKLAHDEEAYKTNYEQINEEYKIFCKILDRIIRANNLNYKNWRIGMDIEHIDPNAFATRANLIIISSALFDSLYGDEDAIAFILAHELSHLLLNHSQVKQETAKKNSQLDYKLIATYRNTDETKELIKLSESICGNPEKNKALEISQGAISRIERRSAKYFAAKQSQMFEHASDILAITLLTKAGYSPNKAINALHFIDELPEVPTWLDSHPKTELRLKAINEEIEILDLSELERQGAHNLYNSTVLPLKKSIDGKTIILSRTKDYAKEQFIPVSRETKLIQKGYQAYLNNNLVLAENCFLRAIDKNDDNYISPLYLSYINEAQYNIAKNPESLNKAISWAKKANSLAKNNEATIKQLNDVENLKNKTFH